jgi:epoxyqueuosine reductase QueG
MPSPEFSAIKARIDDVAAFYGIEVVGYLKLDRTAVIPEGDIDLLKGVRWSDGCVDVEHVQDPAEILPGAKAMVILGKRLHDDHHDVYYRVSDRYTASVEMMLLDMASVCVAGMLTNEGCKAVEYTSYYNKVWAVLAGLGWIGKSRMFVSKDHGPRLRLKAVLTDADIGQYHKIMPDDTCGDCKECIETCPVSAISETGVDRKKCGACKLNHRTAKNNALSYCTCCTYACPVGKNEKE